MSFLVRQFAQRLIQKVAADPVAREKAARVAAGVAREAKQIAGQKDRAYEAGKAVRRALNKLNNS
ncbi:MAG: hypothetical protein RIF37_15715 [Rhodospirillaceae bacterium]|jgi:hypothetical protein